MWHGNAYFFAIIIAIQLVFICFTVIAFVEMKTQRFYNEI